MFGKNNKPTAGEMPSEGGVQSAIGATKTSKRKIILISLLPLVIVLLFISAFVGSRLSRSDGSTLLSTAQNQPVNEVSLESLLGLENPALQISSKNKLIVNGQLTANDALVLTPGTQPQNPVTGQLYYDQTSNAFSYFDGETFREIASSTSGAEICFVGADCGFLTAADATDPLPQGLSVNDTPQFAGLNLTNSLSVQSGGTGRSTFLNNALLLGNGTAGIASTNAASPGQLIVANSSSSPQFITLSGDATINASGIFNLNANSVTSSELGSSGVTAGVYGNGSSYPIITVDEDGRITSVVNQSLGAGGSVSSLNSLSGALNIQGTVGEVAISDNGLDTITIALDPNVSLLGQTIQDSEVDDNLTISATGSVADGALSTNVTLQGNTFNGANQLVQLNGSSQLPAVSGALLTTLNATNISSGTLADARLSANVSLLGSSIQDGEVDDNLTVSAAGSVADGALSVNVSLLGSAIEGSEITNGTIEEVDLEATNAATDTYVLTYDQASGGFTWVDQAAVGGSGVTSLQGLTGALNINNASGVGSTITIDDASTAQKGIAQFSSNDFSVSSGNVSLVSCSANLVLKHNGTNWACAADNNTTYTAGTGLSLAGTTFNADVDSSTIDLNGFDQLFIPSGGVSTTQIADSTILFADISQNSCGNGDVMAWNGSAWACQTNGAGSSTLASLTDTAITTPVSGQILVYDGVDSWDNRTVSSDITISSTGVATIQPNSVALGTDTTGNYVSTITNGNGISGSSASEGGTPTIALGNLTANWVQGGAFDIILDNAGSELSIRGSGGAFYATLDAGALTGNETFTLGAGSGGTICTTSGNCSGVGGVGDILNNGQNGPVTVGTNDATAVALETNNVNRLTISSSGAATFSGTLDVQGATTSFGVASSTTGALVFNNSTNANTITLQPGATGSNLTFTLPTTSGNLNECLVTNGSGVLSFASCGVGSAGVDSLRGLSGNLNLNGTTNEITITDNASDTITVGLPSAVTIDTLTLTNDLTVANGGTGVGSFTTNGVLYGNGTSGLQVSAAGTTGQVLIANASGVPTFTTLNGDVTVNASGTTTIQPNSVALGTDTTGNYVSTITNGNGISGSSASEGGTPTIALGNLTANWVQGGAFDIILDNAGSELSIRGSGGAFYATLDAGALTGNETFTLGAGSGGTICTTSGNCSGVGSTATLQAAYDAGNTITTTDNRNIIFTLANTTTDSNFLVDIATGSTGRFALQNNGTDVLGVTGNGTITSTGRFLSADGSAAAPTYSFSSGSTAGIYTNTGSDVSVATNGQERLRVDNAGNVGIGATNPTALLTLQGVQPTSQALDGTDATAALAVTGGKGGDTTGTTGQIAGTGAVVSIVSGAGGDAPSGATNGNGGDITIQGGAPGAGLGTASAYGNVLLASSGGRVGIGTASPDATLHVVGTLDFTDVTSNITLFSNIDTAVGSDGQKLSVWRKSSEGDANVDLYVDNGLVSTLKSSKELRFQAGSSLQHPVSLYGSGVGVGTGSPDRMFEVVDTSGPQARLTYTDSSVYADLHTDSSGYLNLTSTGNRITLGAADTTGTLLVLDDKTNAGDPTGANGSLYYNSNLSKFRCYENGAWKDCITGAGSGVTTIGSIDAQTKSANGAVISGTTLYLQTADVSNVGLVSTGGQTFAGNKTFAGNLITQANTTLGDAAGDTLTVNATSTFNENLTVAATKTLRLTGGTTAQRPGSPTEGMLYFDTDTDQLLIYANGKWQADRAESIIVAASDSTQTEKDSADYVADGTADQTEINAALTEAAGGKVYLLPGTYVASATILVPNNTTLAGAGRGTQIELADLDASENLIENSDTTSGTGIVIRDLGLNGRNDLNTAGAQNGIYLYQIGDYATRATGAILTNLWVEEFRSVGIELERSELTTVTNSTLINSFHGLNIYLSLHNTVSGVTMIDNDDSGMKLISSSDNVVSNNNIRGNEAYGLLLNTADTNVIADNRISNSGTSTDNGAIHMISSDSNTITGNAITDDSASVTNYAIEITSGASIENYLANNTLGGGSINDSGTDTIYGGQSSGNDYAIKPIGSIELQSATNITDDLTASGTITFSSLISCGSIATDGSGVLSCGSAGSGVTTVGTFDSQAASADGAVISGSTIYFQSASATNPGMVNTTTQTFAGNKTFAGNLITQANTTLGDAAGDTLTVNATSTFNENLTVAATKTLRLTGGTTAQRPGSPTEGMLYFDTDTDQLLIYANGKWQADRAESIIVAASDSTQTEKDSADYVADGTADQTEINAALTEAAGGKVYLLPGTYTVDGVVQMSSNTTLAGSGEGSVIKVAADGAVANNFNVIENIDTIGGNIGLVIRDLQIDGNRDNVTASSNAGFDLDNVGDDTSGAALVGATIQNVTVRRVRSYGIRVVNSANVRITDNTLVRTNDASIDVRDSTSISITGNLVQDSFDESIQLVTSQRVDISSNVINAGAMYAINLSDGDNNTITGNNIYAPGSDGIRLAGNSGSNMISGNGIYDAGEHGLELISSFTNSVVGNIIHQFGLTNDVTAYMGINLVSNGDRNSLIGNNIFDSVGGGHAISVGHPNMDYTFLSNNVYDGSGADTINDSGTNTIYAGQLEGGGGSGNYIIDPTGTIKLQAATNITGNVTATGTFTAQNATDSTTAYRFLDADGGTPILSIDSTNERVGIGSSSPGNLLSVGALTTTDASATVAVSTGGTTSEGIVVQAVASQTADLIQAQNSSGAVLAAISADGSFRFKELSAAPATPATGYGTLYVKDNGNIYFKNDAGTEYTVAGANTQKVTLTPEYTGATFTPDGTNNTGTLSSDFCSGTSRLSVNTSACAATDEHNYYEWTTASGSAQDYDIYVRWQVPNDFKGFSSSTAIQMYGWRSSTSTVDLELFEASATQCGTTTNVATGTSTWSQVALGGDETACTVAAGDTLTLRIKVTASASGGIARAGSIYIEYESGF